jgi:hypothetical protein
MVKASMNLLCSRKVKTQYLNKHLSVVKYRKHLYNMGLSNLARIELKLYLKIVQKNEINLGEIN